MHELLLRDMGHAIDSQRLVDDPRYARDVLLVCDAIKNPDLQRLAKQFRNPEQAPEALPPAAEPAPGYALQRSDWAADTSGFGVTLPPPLPGQALAGPAAPAPAPAVERRRTWLGHWRRG